METNKYSCCTDLMLAAHWEHAMNRGPTINSLWVELCHELDNRKLDPSIMVQLLKQS